jgi:hypothetical protein
MTDTIARPCTPATSGCGCGGVSACPCGSSGAVGLERTHWFAGQLVGPEDLTQEQRYFRDKSRRHNRLLHGWGVVCGLDVAAALNADKRPEPYRVTVGAGYVLGPFGDEIVVVDPVEVDIRTRTVNGDVVDACGPPPDPWCADVHVAMDPKKTWYLAIRYDECLTRPVRSPGACGCGCDSNGCEFSRVRDSFAIAVLDELPPSHRTPQKPEKLTAVLEDLFRPCGQTCPPCPEDPWVVLADLTIGADGAVKVDELKHRRWVVSFGSYGYVCSTKR